MPRPAILFFACLSLMACTSVTPSSPPTARTLIIDPRHLLNVPLALIDALPPENQPPVDLRKGRLRLLIMHISCPTCQSVAADLKAHPDPASPLVVLNLAQDDREDPTLLAGLPQLRVPPTLTISSPIPLLLDLRDGIVVNVKEDFP